MRYELMFPEQLRHALNNNTPAVMAVGVIEYHSEHCCLGADALLVSRALDILEKEVIPCYYKVSEQGVPHDWVKVMKETLRSNAAKFSARRMVKEYVRKFYSNALNNVSS